MPASKTKQQRRSAAKGDREMKIRIKETNQIKELHLFDTGPSRADWIKDFIGNTGALNDGQFSYDDELESYACDNETFDWWEKVVDAHQRLELRKYELTWGNGWIGGSEHLTHAIYDAENCDLEDQPAAVNALLDAVFGEDNEYGEDMDTAEYKEALKKKIKAVLAV